MGTAVAPMGRFLSVPGIIPQAGSVAGAITRGVGIRPRAVGDTVPPL